MHSRTINFGNDSLEILMDDSGRFYVTIYHAALFTGKSLDFISRVFNTIECSMGGQVKYLACDLGEGIQCISLIGFSAVISCLDSLEPEEFVNTKNALMFAGLQSLALEKFSPCKDSNGKVIPTGTLFEKIQANTKGERSSLNLKRTSKSKTKKTSELKTADHVYLIADKEGLVCKIGISKNPRERLKAIQTSYPRKLELIQSKKVGNAAEVERLLHLRLSNFRLSGEWFQLECASYIDWDSLSVTGST